MIAPGIQLIDAFVGSPELLFNSLKSTVAWDERMKARKTASFGVSYNYSQISYDPSPMPLELEAICIRLAQAIGFKPNNCLLNYYPDGDSSMGTE